ncbi:MAG: sulfatase [Planctomycetota bacterium]|nr:sulfatase [Planctomycetota bacterium]
MAPRRALLVRALLLVAPAVGCGDDEPWWVQQGNVRPPNLILIVIDTLRADILLEEVDEVISPNIDRLAADGISFAAAFAHAPMTLPSHTALFSSRYPHESGVLCNYQSVPESLPLLSKHLGDLGYGTHAVISLGTLWNAKAGKNLDQGFDTYVRSKGHLSRAADVFADLEQVIAGLDPNEPFFLFAHFSDPHEPYNLHSDDDSFTATILLDGVELETVTTSDMTWWVRNLELEPGEHTLEVRSQHDFALRSFECYTGGEKADWELVEGQKHTALRRARVRIANGDASREFEVKLWLADYPLLEDVPRRYFREVEYVDRYVGELLRTLKSADLYDSSLIVFTSDHGEALGERGWAGHVETLFDELVHVPLIVKPPRGYPDGDDLRERVRSLVRHVDVVPTVLEMLDLPPLDGQRGRSILDWDGARVLVAETHQPQAQQNLFALRDEGLKLIYFGDEDRFEMYDVVADPSETQDVFAERGDERADWQEQLRVIARLASTARIDLDELDAETLETLRALGY